ncbi:MAG: hypothetical protein AAGK00_18405 [Pseudomonadota bacterium]
MITETQKKLLLDEFPELQFEDVDLSKEVLSHFGLLFSGFALLEAAIQNCFVFWKLHSALLAGEINSQDDWVHRHKSLETSAFAATFGTLLKLTADCPDLASNMNALKSLREKRNYFAHHFFREENVKMFSDESRLDLIWGMNAVRLEVKQVEIALKTVSEKLLFRIYPNLDIQKELDSAVETLKADALKNPSPAFGWEGSS